jgi:predicted RNase H-like HicB family nuclease
VEFYTSVLRRSAGHWVALCLENGIVGQGKTKEEAVASMKDGVDSFISVMEDDPSIYTAPLSIKELHEFLTVEGIEDEPLEMRTVYA